MTAYHKGKIENVTVNADVSLAEVQDVAYLTALGGLAGRVTTGTLTDCVYAGNISVPVGFTSAKKLLIGGLAAYFTNTGTVSGSDFKGTISNEAQVTSTDKTNPYVVIGGVVGYLDGGATVSDCETSDNAAVGGNDSGNYSATKATIVNKTLISYHSAQGGIVGENYDGTVSSCTNAASIFVNVAKSDNADANGRYISTGGIVGDNRSTVKSCINNGTILHRSNPRIQYLGGIVGINRAASSLGSCTNNATLQIATVGAGSYSARIPYFGGVAGCNYSADVSDVHNNGDLSISRIENNTGSTVYFGGVIGYSEAAIDGGSSQLIDNSGSLTYNCTVSNQISRYCMGGVLGYTKASVSNVANSGTVEFDWNASTAGLSLAHIGGAVGYLDGSGTIASCSNSAPVYLSVTAGSKSVTNNYVGGILGCTVSDVSITGCTNSGYVHGGNTTKVNGSTLYVGGIAAYLAGASSVSGCSNTGEILNDQFNNTTSASGSTFEGGIAGFVQGTEDNRITISNVTNEPSAGKGGRRGYTGGIVGYASFADISNASSNHSYTGGSGYYIGGVAGWLVNSTITSGTYTGTTIQTTQLQGGGGIVAVLGDGSVIDSCSSYAVTIDKNGTAVTAVGAIAGSSAEGSTIKDSHYVDSLGICSDSNFTGSGNAADLSAL